MQAPILTLSRLIAEAPSRIAPEKAAELEAFSNQRDLSIEHNDDLGFGIKVRLKTNTIVLPIRALNYLWCATNLFVSLYFSWVRAQEQQCAFLDTAKDPSVSAAIDLFNWSRVTLRGGSPDWPSDHSLPSADFEPNSKEHFVVELFLCAVAWIIHHERAHVELEHQGNSSFDSVREERQADRNATEWVMKGCADVVLREKRALGIAVATLAMALLDNPHEPVRETTTHPPDLERLFENLEIANIPAKSFVFEFCIVVMAFCIQQYGTALTGTGIAQTVYRDLLVQFQTRHRAG